jgi:dUTP pyrophosphatase
MALPGHLAATIVGTALPEQIQPAGVDLRIAEVHAFLEKGFLGIGSERKLPRTRKIVDTNGVWDLAPGAYKIVFADIVEVPSTAIGFCLPRSSLLRMGALIACGFWDPGYRGRGEALLVVGNENGIRITRGARIAQLVFIRVNPPPIFPYSGYYQGERLENNKDDENVGQGISRNTSTHS